MRISPTQTPDSTYLSDSNGSPNRFVKTFLPTTADVFTSAENPQPIKMPAQNIDETNDNTHEINLDTLFTKTKESLEEHEVFWSHQQIKEFYLSDNIDSKSLAKIFEQDSPLDSKSTELLVAAIIQEVNKPLWQQGLSAEEISYVNAIAKLCEKQNLPSIPIEIKSYLKEYEFFAWLDHLELSPDAATIIPKALKEIFEGYKVADEFLLTAEKMRQITWPQFTSTTNNPIYFAGTRYGGQVNKHGLPHGQGSLIFVVNSKEQDCVYEGSFKNGVPDGEGRLFLQGKYTLTAHFEQGIPKNSTLTCKDTGYVFPHIIKENGDGSWTIFLV